MKSGSTAKNRRFGPPGEGEILKLVRSRRYRPMTADEMAERLGVAADDLERFRGVVRELELAGEIVEVKRGRLAAPEKVDLIVGRLQCHPRGFAFLLPVREQDGADLYVSAEDQGAAMHGDLAVVSVSSQPRRRGRRAPAGPSGKVVSVLERARETLVGTYRRDARFGYVVPEDPRYFRDVYVAEEDSGDAEPGDKVVVRITAWPRKGLNPEGAVEEVLGGENDPRAMALAVIREYGLRDEFPPEALEEAESAPSRVSPADERGRLDLRDTLAFTIDPEDARDFDDAVSVRPLRDGWELGVHIADVAHYVRPGSAIDREARERGTSVYLPGCTLHMLPEALSAGICSLQEGRVRLTRSVFMRFDRSGEMLESRIAASFIRSRKRLDYAQVLAFFEGRDSLGGDIEEALRHMRGLAAALRQWRERRGMLNLDLPEPRVMVDEEGRATGVEIVRNDESHGLIEQFMLSANEAVARHLAERGLPYVGRCHDEPDGDALSELREDLKAMGYSLGMPATRKQIQQVVARAAGTDDAPVVNMRILRAMKRAEYRPAQTGHYAIAARLYTHFTSPIRRYPDLLVHRILTESENGLLRDRDRADAWKENLPAALRAASESERAAEDAERELTRRRLIELALRRRDEPFEALITRVDERGAIANVLELGLEGRISMGKLRDDFYRFDRRGARLVGRGGGRIAVGKRMRVRLAEADPATGGVEFAPWGRG